jgi:16S rRNA (cytosine967-C5)-methyltransferase
VAVAERIYDVFRHRASYGWRMGSDSARALVVASVLSETGPQELQAMFAGLRYGPTPLDDVEKQAVASAPPGSPPIHVQGEFPQWLESELVRSLGDDLLAEMKANLARAPIDLRVNSLKSTRDTVHSGLQLLGITAEATALAPHGIRIVSRAGLGALQATSLYRDGLFEFQDEGSQIVARLVDAHPNERIFDFAAGAGGKALAIAADMNNKGEILAFDAQPERMRPLAQRSLRAGATIIRPVAKLPENTDFAAVLVDAPCSGSGIWRRNPDAKWRLPADTMQNLIRIQGDMLDRAAGFVGVGGRLIYATCSVLKCENEDAVDGFLSRNRAFRRIAIESLWPRLFNAPVPQGCGNDFRATPLKTGTDGFFASIMVCQ